MANSRTFLDTVAEDIKGGLLRRIASSQHATDSMGFVAGDTDLVPGYPKVLFSGIPTLDTCRLKFLDYFKSYQFRLKMNSMKIINLFMKRLFDFSLSSIILMVLSPLFLICIFLIKITMPGPIFFKQCRLGIHGTIFKIYKFRTMNSNKVAEDAHNAAGDNLRLTRLGLFLRRFKIDELPQLINVLIGNMSLVGPRPAFPEHLELYNERELHRLDMKPGMTGLAQVNGNGELIWEDRIQYDILYIERFTILLDLEILLKTIFVVLKGERKFVKRFSDSIDSKYKY